MVKQVVVQANIPCVDQDCRGSMDGIYGGKFRYGEAEYVQYLSCKCNACGLEKGEVFEVFSDRHGYYLVGQISIFYGDISFTWEGFRIPIAEIEDPVGMLVAAGDSLKDKIDGCDDCDD